MSWERTDWAELAGRVVREQSVSQSVRQSIAFLLAFHLRQQTETEAAPAVLAKLYGRIVVELSLSSLGRQRSRAGQAM